MRISEALNPKLPPPAQSRSRKSISEEKNPIQKTGELTIRNAKVVPPAELYGKLIHTASHFTERLRLAISPALDLDELCESVERAMETMHSVPDRILELTLRSTPGDYLPGHIVNVTLVSLAVAQELKWEKERMRLLGVGAFLHDAALAKLPHLYTKEGALTAEEKKILQNLPKESVELLKDLLEAMDSSSRKTIENILLQTHERISGKGTPSGLKGTQILPEAQLLGLADTYEAISHPRPYRPAKHPHEALRALIELSGDAFDGVLMKALWGTLSLFPPGSYVKLSTAEIAKVVSLNKKNPTAPVVQVILSLEGEEVTGEKIMDLAQTQEVSIERAVDEALLKTKDPAVALRLKAQKWWLA